MSETVIKVERLSKRYRLGTIGGATLREDVNRLWAKLRGKPDPTLKIDQIEKLEKKAKTKSGSNPPAPLASSPASPLPLASSQDGHIWALRDISFEVKRGEILGIIGRNGAGKSTLLKILSRITAPTSGEIKIKGRVGSLLEVGTGFHPELTGRENIYLNGAILGMTKDEVGRKLDEIVYFSDIEKFIDTPVKRYSSGMYVRLAFSVAAHLEPEILIVDEVLAVGDIPFQHKCIAKMKDVSGQGRTILLVSHNMTSIRSLATKCFLLEKGKFLCQGHTGEVVNKYMQSGVSSNESSIDLAEHDKRLPGMKPYLRRISCRNAKGEFTNHFFQDERICIEITYRQAGPIKPTHVGFGIFTTEGIRVTGFNTAMAFSLAEKTIQSSGTVIFLFDVKSINPGTYLISPAIATLPNNLIDKVEHAIAIRIQQSDIYGTGYVLSADDGVLALNCTVRMNE